MTFKDFCIVVSFTLFLVGGVVELTTEYRPVEDGSRAGTLRDRRLRALADRADLVPDDERTAAPRLSDADASSRVAVAPSRCPWAE